MRKIKNFILMLVMLFSFVVSVKAESYINEETIKVVVEGISGQIQQGAYVRIYDAEFISDRTYAATITKDTTSIKDELSLTNDDYEYVSDLQIDDVVIEKAGFSSVVYLPLAEQYGDMYVTFYVNDTDKVGYYKKVSEPILIEKPENLKISKRFRLYPFDDYTSIFYYNLGSISTERKVNYKLGRVTDKSILKKIQNGDYTGLEELLVSAKNDTQNITEGQIKVNSVSNHQPVLYQQKDLIEGEYYYIYLELDDENGSYYELDDVNLYQCLNNDGVLWLTDVNDSRFQWNIDESLWDRFIEEFKNTELVSLYDDSDAELKITSTENSLSVVLTNEGETFNTKFTYENGILKYESGVKEDEAIFADSMWQMNALLALCELKGYNIDKVSKWLEENSDKVLTLENDGIEYVSKDYEYESEEDGVSTSITTNILTSFELDLQNGLKSYDEEKISDYEFIFGENQKYKVNETKELKFEIDAEYSLFENVYVNGKLLDASNYTTSEGSTIVVLKKEYLDTLNNGVHTLKVTFKDGGFAQTEFTIEKTVKNPSTGMGITYGILILALVFAGIYTIIRKQSKFPKHN